VVKKSKDFRRHLRVC